MGTAVTRRWLAEVALVLAVVDRMLAVSLVGTEPSGRWQFRSW